MKLKCRGGSLDLAEPRVMGVLNVTPDSFSDGGRFLDPDRALAQGRQMAAEGAAIIDVGGESTRPRSLPVSVKEETARVVPVIERLSEAVEVPVSIDTSKPEVMRKAVNAGAGMINDVYALRQPGALQAAADLNVPVCLMHMQGEPRTMQDAPRYADVVDDIKTFLRERIARCEAAGIGCDQLVIDPGFGFGKTHRHNVTLLRRLPEFLQLGRPLLVGVSRKSFLARAAGARPAARLYPGVAAAALAVWQGATLVRTHDVKPTVEALALVDGLVSSPEVVE